MKSTKFNNYQFGKQDESISMAFGLEKHLIDIRKKNLQKVMSSFEGSHHKLEYVKTIKNVDFIDDAAAENINAVWYALSSMYKPTLWIMNLADIDVLTDSFLDILDQKVSKIVIQGVYNSEVLDFFTGLNKEVFFAMNIDDAVRTALYACDGGEVILYSPGVSAQGTQSICERGENFKYAIAQL
ncbi:MAG: hypothetical protein LBU51_08485 [Bacteroidales bacterium]|jgi:UDP-N-acetylmuramoylalanine--D-glutamate ligase|nr:hypothetical protein [Bacteroidales bacterium]